MNKIYKANTDVSITIKVGNRSKHISFMPLTAGSSFYTTADKKIQEGIEKHWKFGKSIILLKEIKEEKVKKPVAEEKTMSDKVKVIQLGSVAEAKDYLAENFNAVRSKLRSKVQIEEFAKSVNVQFVGGVFGGEEESTEKESTDTEETETEETETEETETEETETEE